MSGPVVGMVFGGRLAELRRQIEHTKAEETAEGRREWDEIDKLPDGTVGIDADGDPWRMWRSGEDGGANWRCSAWRQKTHPLNSAPFTVLYVPDAPAETYEAVG